MKINIEDGIAHVYRKPVIGMDSIYSSLYIPDEIAWEFRDGKVYLTYPDDTSGFWLIPFIGSSREIVIYCIDCFCHHISGYCKVSWAYGKLACVSDPSAHCSCCIMELNSAACDRVLFTGGGVLLKARKVIDH